MEKQIGTYSTDKRNNKKSTAYMLDTTIWKSSFIKKNGMEYTDNIEYVIGGMTIEMLCDSYNKRNNLLEEKITPILLSEKGYDIDIFGAKSPGLLSQEPWNNGDTYWIASPSVVRDNNPIEVNSSRCRITGDGFARGFRPVICLKSNVELKINYAEDGTTINSYSIE